MSFQNDCPLQNRIDLKEATDKTKSPSLPYLTIKKKHDIKPNKLNQRKGKVANKFSSSTPIIIAGQSIDVIVESAISKNYLGELTDLSCQFCRAYYFKSELPSDKKMNMCCNKGNIHLPTPFFDNYPSLLRNLLTRNHDKSTEFFKHIRSYNNSLAFATSFVNEKILKKGPPVIRVNGMIYHNMRHFDESLSESNTAQIYLFDTNEATDRRHMQSDYLHKDLLKDLDILLRIENKYTEMYKMAKDIYDESRVKIQQGLFQNCEIMLGIVHDRNTIKAGQNLRGAYNMPTTNEVCCIFDKTSDCTNRDVVITAKKGNTVSSIHILNPNRDSLVYPILLPHAEQTFAIETILKKNTKIRNKVSCCEYYSYILMPRENIFNQFLAAGKLTQQFFIEVFLKIEDSRLAFLRNEDQQKKLRIDTYNGLNDFVENQASKLNVKAGRVFILPSSFTGSERNNVQNYMDAMAVVQKYGKPDYFITFTCNKDWAEIKSQLLQAQIAEDRPDLVVRAFHAKLAALMVLLKTIFGIQIAVLYTIEFQKRGLPHAHILLFVRVEDRVLNGFDVDMVVSAEIPNPKTHPILYEIVRKSRVHGPCRSLNPDCPCMIEKKCKSNYPKDFRSTTALNPNGYPSYKRPENDRTIKKKVNKVEVNIDNRNIVPFNPFLLLTFDAHINVEVCSSIQSIKYLFKYINKGNDRAKVKKVSKLLMNSLIIMK